MALLRQTEMHTKILQHIEITTTLWHYALLQNSITYLLGKQHETHSDLTLTGTGQNM